MLLSRCGIPISVIFTLLVIHCQAKSPCDICKDIVASFKTGLEKTVKSNFGGGNTNWEENSLGKWKTSETRLVEIIDHHICQGNDKECHMFFERNEEHLEDWYFNKYENLDSADSLHDHLCVEQAKACCLEGKYGKNCADCPVNEGKVCNSHGKCQGDATRSGDGSCKCDAGYTGKVCDECADSYYEQLTGSIGLCLSCHESCEDTCSGGDPIACDDCKDGYDWSDNLGCQDVNECTSEDDPCFGKEGTFCSNSIGSYHCKSCHSTCQSCIGGSSSDCTECIDGYERITAEADISMCTDLDECAARPDLCTAIKGAMCHNTEGSYECRCEQHNQKIQGDECIDIVEVSKEAEETNNDEEKIKEQAKKNIDQNINQSKEPSKNKETKGKGTKRTAKKSKQVGSNGGGQQIGSNGGGQPKIDLDAMMKEAGSLPKGTLRKYRTLDSMVLTSATGLYLVMCLVFNAEFFKTTLVTAIYSVFLYMYAGQYV